MNENDKQNFTEYLEASIHYQMTNTWLNLINSVEKDRFLNNFKPEDKIIGLVLLDMLLFHNQAEEKQLILSLIRKLMSAMYKRKNLKQDDSSKEINSYLQKEMEAICFIPVTDEDPADSSNAWTSILSEFIKTRNEFASIDNLPIHILENKHHIVFYDDMLGTGSQFERFLEKPRFSINERNKISISKLIEQTDTIHFYYMCIAAHKDGIQRIKNKWNQITILASEIFDDKDDILSKENEYWELYENEIRDELIAKIAKYINEFTPDEKFTKNLPIIFERNRPSNTTFPLYWYNQSTWKPLKPR